MKKQINTCVIGSYPVYVDSMDLMNGYFDQKSVSWNKYIENAVNDMINAGINIISDGQTRDPFIQIFTRKLNGCRIRNRTEIIDKVEFKSQITVDDQIFVKKLIPKNIKLIGLITGPYTLTKSCIDLFYNDEKKLAFDFAYALKEEAKILEKHVDLISIDEPFFSNEIPEYGKELINIITKDLNCPIRLHACGDVSNIISDLIEMPVDILSHEFKLSPQLFDAFKEYSIPQNICLGSVRSDDTKVEPVEEIKAHIQKGLDLFGDKICQIAPDCGLRMMPRNIAFQKLVNLSKAGEQLNG